MFLIMEPKFAAPLKVPRRAKKKKDILCCHSTDNLQTIHVHTYFCINKRKQQSRGGNRYLNKSELPHIEDISLEALVPSCKQHARNQ